MRHGHGSQQEVFHLRLTLLIYQHDTLGIARDVTVIHVVFLGSHIHQVYM
jgi:hypothetical protein